MDNPTPPVSSAGQANCHWCSKPMNNDAMRCSSCGKLRKDIYTDKVRCYVLCLIGGLLIGISISQWKGSNRNQFEYYYNTDSSGDNTLSYVLLALGIIAALAGLYYYARVSRRLKTWWWM
jgi:hypothetical protein